MTTIGTAVLQIIPSLDGVSAAVDKQLSGLSGMGKKAGKQLGGGIATGLKDAEAAYTKLQNKAEDSLGKIRIAETALTKARGSGDNARITAAEERLSKARRDSGVATREAETALDAFKRAQDSAAGSSRGLASVLDLNSASMAKWGAIAGGVAAAGIAAVVAGAVTAGKELYSLGAQFDDLSDNLQVKTGLSGAALDSLKASVEKLGTTNVPDTFENIGNVVAETTRNLHLSGKPLEEITSRLANLQRMGVDVDVRALGKAFRGFGVDVKGQVSALNGLYEASTKSGLSIDDMLASVVKGGPALRALGLSFGESAALVSTFEDAGLDADKSIAGLTKGLANFSKDGKSGSDALRDAVTQIKALADAGNEAGAIDLSNKLFGAKGGVAFFDAIKSGNLDLQSLRDSLGQTGVDINQVSADTADWSEKWQDLKNEVAVALEPLAGSIFDQVNGQLDDLSVWVTGHKDEVIDFFVGFGETAISAAQVTTSAFSGVIDFLHLFDTVVMKSLSWLPGYDDEAAKAFNDSLGDLSTKLNAASDSGMWNNLRDKLHGFGEEAKNSGDDVLTLSGAIGQLAGRDINVPIKIDTADAENKIASIKGQLDGLKGTTTGTALPTLPGGGASGPGKAAGGAIFGAGTGTSDSIPAWLSNGEHVWTADEVNAVGGQSGMYRMRGMALAGAFGKFATGGAVGPDVQAATDLVGTTYSQGKRTDCSGMVARVIDRTLGMPDTGLMSTKNAAEWLAARGFKPGIGGPGQISVGWYDHGPNPNDGHMAMTLSNGTNAESGGKNGVFTLGPGASGATSPQFDQHMFLPTLYGEGPAGSAAASPFAGGSAVAAVSGGGGAPAAPSGGGSSSGGGGGFSLPSSFSGLATAPFDAMTAAGKANSGPGHRDPNAYFPEAASKAVSGQIDSALGFLGVNGSPAWLKGIGDLIGGIGVSDKAGNALFGGGASWKPLDAANSAAPLSASPSGMGTPPPDDPGNMHGTRAGQQPGPVYNITARDTEDAFIRAQRLERQKAAAKLSRY